jgi:hypothetical protein
VSGTAAGAGERVAAAAVAIAMATTVGVGAVALKDRVVRDPEPVRDRKPRVETVVQAPSPAPNTVSPKIVTVPDKPAPKPEPKKATDKAKQDAEPAVEEPVVGSLEDPVAEPSETSTPSVEPSPGPEATETAPPPPPPAPAWSMRFSAIGKKSSLSLLTSSVSGTAGTDILFSQVATGALGVGGRIPVHAEYWGSADGSTGSAGLWLFLDTAGGRYRFDGSGAVGSVATVDGKTVYRFSGAFTRTESPAADDSRLGQKMPMSGTFELTLSFWEDGTSLYRVGLSLIAADAGSVDEPAA